MGVMLVAAVLDVAVTSTAAMVIGFGINMVASAIISKAFLQSNQSSDGLSGQSADPGNRLQLSPATDNKLPIVYGTAYVGGIVTDLTITSDNQNLYYCIALCEVTNSENGNTGDTFTFGNIYYGGKLVQFDSNGYTVTGLLDESTGIVDTKIAGYINIYLYSNGSYSPTNSSINAITVMSASGLTYQWDNTKLMTNCVFAIVQLTYNSNAGVTGLQQTKFQITNSRTNTGDCFLDYLTSSRYGCAIPLAQIDTASLTALNTYSNQNFTYTPYSGGSATIKRFEFDGVLDPSDNCMSNLQNMSTCCDCLIKYNEILGLWGVIVQSTAFTVVMDINDSNMVSSLQITPLDIVASYNVIQVKYPDNTNQDAFASVTYDLSQIDPAILYPNEPVNQVSLSLPLVNNDIRSQYLANRLLKSGREDLQVQCTINYTGLQLEAGDVVTITNANYGWVAKLMRISKVVEMFADSGEITANLVLTEFNPAVYDDLPITQFSPLPNTGLGDPNSFGTVPAPTIVATNTYAAIPTISVQATTSSAGITQYVEIWYSAFSNPSSSQYIFAGTSQVQSSGLPYGNNIAVPNISLGNIPLGNWYFFSRMVNSLTKSNYSSASTLVQWRPTTYQFTQRYLSVAYADSITGTGFNYSSSGKTYYGLVNQSSTGIDPTPADYTWYPAPIAFGTTNYLLYNNYGNKIIGFSVGLANYASGNGAFVPSDTTTYDPSIWLGLPNGKNIIDLNYRTGQVIQTGTTSTGTGELQINNNPEGLLQASLAQLLTFPGGATTYTSSVATLTVDRYGRVVGFVTPDNFYYTMTAHIATSGQTVFNITRGTEYRTGNTFVFQNGLYLDQSQWTDGSSQITLAINANTNDVVTIISMASVGNSLITTGASGTGSIATLTFATQSIVPFTIGESITISGVTPSGYNGTYTVTNCTTSSVSFANTTTGSQTVAGTIIGNRTYNSFNVYSDTLSNQANYTTSGWLVSGNELIFLNGTVVNAQDYNISGQTISFNTAVTGDMQVIIWANNNQGQPNGIPQNTDLYTIIGQTIYPFTYNPLSFNLYNNGVLLLETVDYTVTTGSYTLSQTPTTNLNILVEQTFNRTGAV